MEINLNDYLIELDNAKDYFAMLMEHRNKFDRNPLYYSCWPSGTFIRKFKKWMLENNLIDNDLFESIEGQNDMEDIFYSCSGIYDYYNIKQTEVKSCQVLCDYLITRLDGINILYDFLSDRNTTNIRKVKRNEKYNNVSSYSYVITDEEKQEYDNLYNEFKKMTFEEVEKLAKTKDNRN